jgi:hypothetical protein
MALCIGQTTCTNNYKPLLLSLPEDSDEPQNETRVAKLTLPEPASPSNKIPITKLPDPVNLSSFNAFRKLSGLKLSLDTGILWLSDDLPSAVEDYLPTNNLNIKFGMAPKVIGPDKDHLIKSKWIKWSANLNLKWARNVHLDADDADRFIPLNLGSMLEIPIKQYAQIFFAGNLHKKHRQFKSPTLFYPNGQEFKLQGKAGVQFNIPQSKSALAVTYNHEFTWFNIQQFKNVISDSFTLFGARQWADTLDLQFTQRFTHPFAPDITAHARIPLYGKRHVPEALAAGKVIVNSLVPIDVTRISAGLALDWEPLSVSGNYNYREFDGWPAEHIGAFNAEYRNTKYGDYGAGWMGLFGIDPTAPVTTHDIQLTARAPFLNRSLGAHISFFDDHFGISLGFDVIRFIDYFTINSTRSRASAPESAPAPAPASQPTSSIIEYDPANPTMYRLLKCGDTEAVKKEKGRVLDCTNKCSSKSVKSDIDVCIATWNQSKL